MATWPPDTPVDLKARTRAALKHPPKRGAPLRIAVHPGALNASGSLHTQVAAIDGGQLTWLGAMGEDLLDSAAAPQTIRATATGAAFPDNAFSSHATARDLLRSCVLTGSRLWQIIRPGELLSAGTPAPLSTIYLGKRPWLVIGQSHNDRLIAAPLNAATNEKWYSPIVSQSAMEFEGNHQDSQVELAHLWTFLPIVSSAGRLTPAHTTIEAKIRAYFLDESA